MVLIAAGQAINAKHVENLLPEYELSEIEDRMIKCRKLKKYVMNLVQPMRLHSFASAGAS
jgi:hypothetical protein